MLDRILIGFAFFLLATWTTPGAHALRVSEFLAICEQAKTPCEDVPVLNAYIGGGLDLIAGLHEDTDYIRPVYCKNTDQFFDVRAIIRFIEKNRDGNENKNAMLLLVKFLETYGDC